MLGPWVIIEHIMRNCKWTYMNIEYTQMILYYLLERNRKKTIIINYHHI